jgi:hypothetical protein
MSGVIAALLVASAGAAVAVSAGAAGPPAVPKIIYDSSVNPLPGNLPSVGPEAYSFTEFGDEVTFANTITNRNLKGVTVTLSSWACQSGSWHAGDCVSAKNATFAVPVTFNVYAPATNGAGVNTAGTLLATQTKTFLVPYRPSADATNCTDGRWFKKNQGCFNGLASNITFDFTALHVQLPGTVVYGITYNTSHYGPSPIGEATTCFTNSAGCPYDSLNIGLAPAVTVGSKPFADTVFQNAVYAADYCDNGADGVGTMRLDSAIPNNTCWTGYIPAVSFTATK